MLLAVRLCHLDSLPSPAITECGNYGAFNTPEQKPCADASESATRMTLTWKSYGVPYPICQASVQVFQGQTLMECQQLLPM